LPQGGKGKGGKEIGGRGGFGEGKEELWRGVRRKGGFGGKKWRVWLKGEKKGEKLFLEVRKRSQKSQKMVFIREL